MKTKHNFTDAQLSWFKSYVNVQVTGIYNMIVDWQLASQAANLIREQYQFVIDNYSELREALMEDANDMV